MPITNSQRFFQNHHRTVFYVGWLALTLLQAIFTDLLEDEAYYWVFSRYLDWGYFDHPPMVALLIKIGSFFFGGELGVRLLPVIMSAATIYITEKLTAHKAPYLFYAIVLSIAVLQVSGFVAVPDIPLMFFTALFFWIYRKFLAESSWLNAILLGVTAAALLYSKYHGALVVFFVLLSNLNLLRNAKVYAAGLIALALFMPHLYWQYQHQWVTFRFHLYDRDTVPYYPGITAEYLGGQLLLAGPFAGFVLWPAVFLCSAKAPLEKAFKFTAVGFFLFFLLSTFKGRVEANWTAPALIPLIVLSHRYLQQKEGWRKWLWRLLPLTVLVAIAFRIVMVFNVLPIEFLVDRYHNWKGWPQELKEQTKGRPIVFNSSYQRASMYWFYTGTMAYSLNSIDARRNVFNFLPVEDSLLGKPVYVADTDAPGSFPASIKAPLYTVNYGFDSSFHSFAKISFLSADADVAAGDSLRLNFSLSLPEHYRRYLLQHPDVDRPVGIALFRGREQLKIIEAPFTLQQAVRQRLQTWHVWPALPAGDYSFRFGILSENNRYTHNSERKKLTVKSR